MTNIKLPEHVIKRAIEFPKGGVMVPIEDDRPAIIQPVNLGQVGIAFMQSLLTEQQCPLSSLVASLFNGKGEAFAPLEQGTDLARALQFKTGTWMPTVAIRQWLADYIVSQWKLTGSQLVIADPWMKPGDYKSRLPKLKYFFSGSGVYYMPDDGDPYAALDAAQRASNFLFFGFIISPPVSLPKSGSDVDAQYIAMLAQHTQAVFTRAYDWEGFVVWRK